MRGGLGEFLGSSRIQSSISGSMTHAHWWQLAWLLLSSDVSTASFVFHSLRYDIFGEELRIEFS